MKQIKVTGGNTLTGEIKISGAKNSAVALIPAAILCDEQATIFNVPNISDIDALSEILEYLGAGVKRDEDAIIIDSSSIVNKEIPKGISKKLRASYYFMSALLGKYKKVCMYFPGGCSIGARPIDQTLKGFKALGAKVEEDGDKYTITADELKGGYVYVDMPSVGATINTILVATKASGTTIIENAAKEPEIVNVATFLNNMGAKIRGAGTSQIKIVGVDKLHKCMHEVIPDRIEAGTYIIAGSLAGDNLKISNIIPEHVESLTSKLIEIGVNIKEGNDYMIVSKGEKYKKTKIKTLGYPGFPTDLQQPITTLLTQCRGISEVHETVYERRFQNVEYLNKLGAEIKLNDDKAFIYGPSKLKGKKVTATDLRAGACLVLAGLVAEGTTTIENVDHILRGYENIIEKLSGVGANIKLVDIK